MYSFAHKTMKALAKPGLWRQLQGCVLAMIMILCCSQAAFAQFAAMCVIFHDTYVAIVPAVSSVAIIGLGIGAAVGKVSWNAAIPVAIGIAVMNGYSTMITIANAAYC